MNNNIGFANMKKPDYADRLNDFNRNPNYATVDLARLVFAVIIMWGHCFIFGSSKLFGLSGLLFNRYLSRLGVPFFFTCTGFFLGKKDDLAGSGKKTIFRFLRLYFIWSIIYIPIHLYNIYFSVDKGITIRNVIITFLSGNFPLWWLLGTAQAVLSFLIVYKISKENRWIPLMFATGMYGYGSLYYYTHILKKDDLFTIFFPMEKLVDFFTDPLASVRNGFFFGFIFISMGICMAKKPNEKFSMKFWGYGFLGSMLFGLAEKVVTYKWGGGRSMDNKSGIFFTSCNLFSFWPINKDFK